MRRLRRGMLPSSLALLGAAFVSVLVLGPGSARAAILGRVDGYTGPVPAGTVKTLLTVSSPAGAQLQLSMYAAMVDQTATGATYVGWFCDGAQMAQDYVSSRLIVYGGAGTPVARFNSPSGASSCQLVMSNNSSSAWQVDFDYVYLYGDAPGPAPTAAPTSVPPPSSAPPSSPDPSASASLAPSPSPTGTPTATPCVQYDPAPSGFVGPPLPVPCATASPSASPSATPQPWDVVCSGSFSSSGFYPGSCTGSSLTPVPGHWYRIVVESATTPGEPGDLSWAVRSNTVGDFGTSAGTYLYASYPAGGAAGDMRIGFWVTGSPNYGTWTVYHQALADQSLPLTFSTSGHGECCNQSVPGGRSGTYTVKFRVSDMTAPTPPPSVSPSGTPVPCYVLGDGVYCFPPEGTPYPLGSGNPDASGVPSVPGTGSGGDSGIGGIPGGIVNAIAGALFPSDLSEKLEQMRASVMARAPLSDFGTVAGALTSSLGGGAVGAEPDWCFDVPAMLGGSHVCVDAASVTGPAAVFRGVVEGVLMVGVFFAALRRIEGFLGIAGTVDTALEKGKG